MKLWNSLNRKIKAVTIVAILTAIVTVGNEVVNVYGDRWWTPIVAAVLAVVVGYQTKNG
jgi:hypothetical protein